ncbi:MAG: peptidylprolyl isomerase [Cyanobacteria bacterium P01_H01_bin.15]
MTRTKISSWLSCMLALFVGVGLLSGCGQASDNTTGSAPESTPTETAAAPTELAAAEELAPNIPRLAGMATVSMTVSGELIDDESNEILIEIDGEHTPITGGNFVELVDSGFYDGLIFHRVVREPQLFVVQGGDPKGNGTGGYIEQSGKQRYIPLEIAVKDQGPVYSQAIGRSGGYIPPELELSHSEGAIAMARSGQPDSASSQFYFTLADVDFLDGDYAVFGRVIEGMDDVVQNIRQGDRIVSAKVVSGLENLQR